MYLRSLSPSLVKLILDFIYGNAIIKTLFVKRKQIKRRNTRCGGVSKWGQGGPNPPKTTKNEGFSPPKIPRVVHNFFARVVTLTYSLCFFLLLWLLFIGLCQCICLLSLSYSHSLLLVHHILPSSIILVILFYCSSRNYTVYTQFKFLLRWFSTEVLCDGHLTS